LRVLLGITGGIAAYKAAGLIRAFQAQGHTVEVLPSENALRFVGKTTLEALSGKNIDIDMYSDVAQVRHVELGQQTDLIVVAPATASFLGRLASGIADDLLTNAIMASKAPIVICPAMHTEMWENAATQSNVSTLQSRGIRVMEPATGRLTGSDSGPGRLPEVEDILKFCLPSQLAGRSITITAGGTREAIDEVRFIGNRSSGRMGLEIAKAARDMGARVKLIAANLDEVPAGMEVIRVSSVDQLELAMDSQADALVMAAAVSDFRVANNFPGKLTRSAGLNLELVPTSDLIAEYCVKYPTVFTVAFSLVDQNQDLIEAAKRKLLEKGVSLIVGNTTETLGSAEINAWIVDSQGSTQVEGSKRAVAGQIVQRISDHFNG
jgi:phosphopantothenoylcysteine decarboxylase/phosphopantothenate--cysteine ligase